MDQNKYTLEIQINNHKGLHARPAAQIARLIQDMPPDTSALLCHNQLCASAGSLLEILLLQIKASDKITLQCTFDNKPTEDAYSSVIKIFAKIASFLESGSDYAS